MERPFSFTPVSVLTVTTHQSYHRDGLSVRLSFQPRRIADLQVGLAYTILGMAGLALARFTPGLFSHLPPCIFRSLTGIPCPACGATHAALDLSQLRLGDAFTSNPLFFIIFIALAFWGGNSLAGLFFKKNIKIEPTWCGMKLIRAVIILSFPINWIYLILRTLLL
jgi:hypothetical protein